MRQQLLMFWDINDETKLMILNDILQLDSSIHLILSINDKKSNQYAFRFFTNEYFGALKRSSHPTEDSQLIITSIPQSAATTDILRNSPPTEESTVSVESEKEANAMVECQAQSSNSPSEDILPLKVMALRAVCNQIEKSQAGQAGFL